MKSVSVCYILSYYDPGYVRTRSILNQLDLIPHVSIYKAINNSKGSLRYLETLWKLFLTRLKHNPSIYILGFRGHELFIPIRLLTIGKPLIFDEFNSPYLSFTEEKKDIRKTDLIAAVISRLLNIDFFNKLLFSIGFRYEQSILKRSQHILTDTQSHLNRFAEVFQTPKEKFTTLHVGTDENVFNKEIMTNSKVYSPNQFNVFFYGNLLPLHGINYILQAAKSIQDINKTVHFTIVGGKGKEKQLENIQNHIRDLKLTNITHIEWLDFEKDLPIYMKEADLCLGGPFGVSSQANHVITGKTYQFLAIGKPVIVGKNIDTNFAFKDKENILLVERGDSQKLADIIIWSYDNQEKLKSIGIKGYNLFQEKFSTKALSKVLGNVINKYE